MRIDYDCSTCNYSVWVDKELEEIPFCPNCVGERWPKKLNKGKVILEYGIDIMDFPVNQGTVRANRTEIKSVPWNFIVSHREQSSANHHQSLERLAERGGCNPNEICAIVLGKKWGSWKEISHEHSEKNLNALLEIWNQFKPDKKKKKE